MNTGEEQQTTLGGVCRIEGVGFWSGRTVVVELRPAPAGSGRTFVRSDLTGRPRLAAVAENRVEAERRTVLERGSVRVEMVEHLLSALVGFNVDNCEIWLDGEELPGCDGSCLAYVRAIRSVGLRHQGVPAEYCCIDDHLEFSASGAALQVHPAHAREYHVSYALDCGADSPIPPQQFSAEVCKDDFAREMAPARTFVSQAEAEAIQAQGLARHVTPSDLLVFGDRGPIQNELRFDDECARHKAMDVVGDFALVGARIRGRIDSQGGGHRLNGRAATELRRRYVQQDAAAAMSA